MLSSYSLIFILSILTIATMAAPITVEEEFTNFKNKFNRNYENPEEEQKRFEIFRNNYEKIKEHNKKFDAGEVTYTQGINQFADLTKDEFTAGYTGKILSAKE